MKAYHIFLFFGEAFAFLYPIAIHGRYFMNSITNEPVRSERLSRRDTTPNDLTFVCAVLHKRRGLSTGRFVRGFQFERSPSEPSHLRQGYCIVSRVGHQCMCTYSPIAAAIRY